MSRAPSAELAAGSPLVPRRGSVCLRDARTPTVVFRVGDQKTAGDGGTYPIGLIRPLLCGRQITSCAISASMYLHRALPQCSLRCGLVWQSRPRRVSSPAYSKWFGGIHQRALFSGSVFSQSSWNTVGRVSTKRCGGRSTGHRRPCAACPFRLRDANLRSPRRSVRIRSNLAAIGR